MSVSLLKKLLLQKQQRQKSTKDSSGSEVKNAVKSQIVSRKPPKRSTARGR